MAGCLSLAVVLLGTGIYRYGLVYRLISEKPGFVGVTVFTALLFAPSVTAFTWRTWIEKQKRLAAFAFFVVVCWLALAMLAQRTSAYMVYWALALTLGLMEALLLPALQGWFAEEGERGLASGMSILFAFTCISLFASPILLKLSAPIPLPAIGLAGAASLLAMIYTLEKKPYAAPRALGGAQHMGDHSVLAVLFLCGVALGVLSNMIYPITLRVLKMDDALVGLYVCVPMLSASVGSGLRSRLGGGRDSWALGGACVLPLLFMSPYPASFLPAMFLWGACLGFAECGWLARQVNFTNAMSSKYVGVAAGIIVSGALAELGVGPITTIGVGFYAVLLFGGALWAAC